MVNEWGNSEGGAVWEPPDVACRAVGCEATTWHGKRRDGEVRHGVARTEMGVLS